MLLGGGIEGEPLEGKAASWPPGSSQAAAGMLGERGLQGNALLTFACLVLTNLTLLPGDFFWDRYPYLMCLAESS